LKKKSIEKVNDEKTKAEQKLQPQADPENYKTPEKKPPTESFQA